MPAAAGGEKNVLRASQELFDAAAKYSPMAPGVGGALAPSAGAGGGHDGPLTPSEKEQLAAQRQARRTRAQQDALRGGAAVQARPCLP